MADLEGTSGGEADASTGAPDPEPQTGSSEGGEESSSGSTGEPEGESEICWTYEWVGADGVFDLWTDGIEVLGAADLHLLHFDGDDWNEHPSGFRITHVAARDVDDAFVAGWTEVAHFDGTSFTSLPEVPNLDSIEAFEVDADGMLWVAGPEANVCGGIGPCEEPSLMFQWDGSVWQPQPTPGDAADLHTGDGGLWASGRGFLARWDGVAWVEFEVEANSIGRVFGISETEAWAFANFGDLIHLVDGTVEVFDLGYDNVFDFALDDSGALLRLLQVDDAAVVERLDGETWSAVGSASVRETMVALDDGSILVGGEADGHRIERVAGGVVYERAKAGGAVSMAGRTLDTTMGVDRDGGILRVQDGAWTRTAVPDAGFLHGIAISDEGDGWAIGHESLVRLDGSVPTLANLSLPNPQYTSIYADPEGAVFLAGATSPDIVALPMLLQNTGGGWSDIWEDFGHITVTHVDGADGNIYATTDTALYRFDGESMRLPIPDGHRITTMRAWSAERVFVVAEDLYVHDGSSWSLAETIYPELAGVTGWGQIFGDTTVGFWASTMNDEGEPGMWVFDGEVWEAFDMPDLHVDAYGFSWHPTEDGIWADDGDRIWRGAPCE